MVATATAVIGAGKIAYELGKLSYKLIKKGLDSPEAQKVAQMSSEIDSKQALSEEGPRPNPHLLSNPNNQHIHLQAHSSSNSSSIINRQEDIAGDKQDNKEQAAENLEENKDFSAEQRDYIKKTTSNIPEFKPTPGSTSNRDEDEQQNKNPNQDNNSSSSSLSNPGKTPTPSPFG